MGKALWILVIVIAIWLGLQYWTTEPAVVEESGPTQTRAQAVGQRVQQSLDDGAARQEALIPE
jgi:hypothetical protein